MGARIIVVVAGCAALAAFIWSLIYESRWLDRVTLPFLVGIIAASWWLFVANLGLEIAENYRPHTAFAALLLIVFTLLLAATITLAFGQELAYRSPFFEQGFFTDILPHWAKRSRPSPAPDIHIRGRVVSKAQEHDDSLPQAQGREVDTYSELHLFLMLVARTGSLVRDVLVGQKFANGTRLTKSAWQRCVNLLVQRGYVRKNGVGYTWVPPYTAEIVLRGYMDADSI
jgi:hypothetical protein